MEQYSEDEIDVTINKNVFVSDEDAADKLGLTELQKKYGDARFAGCNQTQSARLAGYSGEGARLRSTASEVERSAAVQAYIAWKRSGQAGIPDDPASREEIKRTLSRILRNEKDRSTAIRAAEALHRIDAFERDGKEDVPGTPVKVLDAMAVSGELGLLLAVMLSRQFKLDWEPPTPIDPDAERRQIERVRTTMTSDDLRRAEHFASLQNSSNPLQRGPLRGQARSHPDIQPNTGNMDASGAVGRKFDSPRTFLDDGVNPAHTEGALGIDRAGKFLAETRRSK